MSALRPVAAFGRFFRALAGNPAGGEADRVYATRNPVRRTFRYAFASAVIAMLVTIAALSLALLDGYLPSTAAVTAQRTVVLQAADGQPLLSKGAFRLAPVAVNDLPRDVINAVLSIEDRRFYQHGGIDVPSMLRAAIQNLRAGEIVAGGSTITQQLVKMLYLNPQRTYARKLHEAAIAIWLELHLSKDQILSSYLNNVYLGSGAIGFPAAAQLYFSKDVRDLTVPEAAMLAGMINAPSQDDPLHNLTAARSRAAIVIDAMVANGKLTQAEALKAKLHLATPIPSAISPPSAGWFADWVHDRVMAAIPARAGTVRVRTTLDPRLQTIAADAVKSALAAYGGEKHVTQAALVAMRPDGAVVAMIGGRSYAASQFNRAVQAQRQPGSAFKLFDYYAALRQGFSPEDKVLDAPIDVHGWAPENYGRRYHGEVTLAEAFADSLNDATVRLSQEIGIDQVIAAARDLGLRAPLGRNPSIALGTADVSLLHLTSAYAAVRAGVTPVEPWGVAAIRMPDESNFVPVGGVGALHSLGPYQAKLIELLRGVVADGTGRAAALPGFAAGKTGTTQDYRDAWFIGFNNSLVVGVWVGNDDHSPMKGVVGGSIPAMIWKNFMERAGATATVASGTAPDAAKTPETMPQKRRALFDQSTAEVAGAEGGACNIPVCEQYYQSFRVSDCSYQPYSGGPRRVCIR